MSTWSIGALTLALGFLMVAGVMDMTKDVRARGWASWSRYATYSMGRHIAAGVTVVIAALFLIASVAAVFWAAIKIPFWVGLLVQHILSLV